MKICILAFLVPLIGFSATETVELESSRHIKVVISRDSNKITAKVSFLGVRSLGKETNDLVNSESSKLYAVEGLSKILAIPPNKKIEIQGINLIDYKSDSKGQVKATVWMSSYQVVDPLATNESVSKHPESKDNQIERFSNKESTLFGVFSDWKQIIETASIFYKNKLEKIWHSKTNEEIDLTDQIFDNADQADAAFKIIESEIINDRFLLTNERDQLLEIIKNKKSEIISLSKEKINNSKAEIYE